MFPMTITIANTAQLNAVMSALALDNYEPKPVIADVKEAAAPVEKPKAAKATPAKTEVPAPTQPTAEAVAAAAPEKTAIASDPSAKSAASAAPASTAATEPATYQDAAAAITKLSRLKGRDSAVALLKDFGAAKLPDVKAEQFAAVIAAANEAMGA